MESRVASVPALDLGERQPKPTALTPDQVEAFTTLWQASGGAVSLGVWECSPGTFTAVRATFHEICVILAGAGTLKPQEGPERALAPGCGRAAHRLVGHVGRAELRDGHGRALRQATPNGLRSCRH